MHRQAVNPDGISYLDIADAYLVGDLSNVVNGYWCPLYSWLLAVALRLTGARLPRSCPSSTP